MMNIHQEMKMHKMLNLSKIVLLIIIAESLSFQLVKMVIRPMKFTAEKKLNLMKKVNYKPFLMKFIQEEEWEKMVMMMMIAKKEWIKMMMIAKKEWEIKQEKWENKENTDYIYFKLTLIFNYFKELLILHL